MHGDAPSNEIHRNNNRRSKLKHSCRTQTATVSGPVKRNKNPDAAESRSSLNSESVVWEKRKFSCKVGLRHATAIETSGSQIQK